MNKSVTTKTALKPFDVSGRSRISHPTISKGDVVSIGDSGARVRIDCAFALQHGSHERTKRRTWLPIDCKKEDRILLRVADRIEWYLPKARPSGPKIQSVIIAMTHCRTIREIRK